MYGLSISIDSGDVRDIMIRVGAGVRPGALSPVMGRAGVNLLKRHLRDYNASHPNALGGKRTNFYAQAARATSFQPTSQGVDLVISHTGIAQRYHGGEIRPVNGKLLTIPAAPEAHGRRAGEFDNLELIGSKTAGFLALVERQSTEISFGRKRKDGTRKVKVKGQRGGKVMFWLTPRVNQKGDPNVLPDQDDITREIRGQVLTYLHRIADRQEAANA